MSKCIDLTGQRFGRLLVEYRVENTKEGRSKWHCKCDCGNECDVVGKLLRKGETQSCGCLNRERLYEAHKKVNEYKIIDGYIIAKTNNEVEFLIDVEYEWLLKNYYWSLDGVGYLMTKLSTSDNCKRISIHRLIVDCPDNMVVDHINGNPLDNRKSNLRIVTRTQNNMNRKISSRNTSGVPGVYFHKNYMKWMARITFDNKCIYLGSFKDFDDAVMARKLAEDKYFGEYSYDNSRCSVKYAK